MTIRDIIIALGFKLDEKSIKGVEDTVSNLKSTATKLLGAIGIGFSLVELNSVAEEFNGINDQIRNATREMGDQAEIQQKILAAANETRTSYGDTAKFVGSLVQENKNLFATVDEAANYAELTAKLFKGAGKSNEEVASLQEAINKSFAKGVVDSETINQLYERAPEAVALLCKELGTAKENLAQMATDGQISLESLKNAFTNNADTINQSFGELDLSISDALLNIRNQWGLFVDGLNSSNGVTKNIAKYMVQGFTKFLDVLKKVFKWLDDTVKKLGGLENAVKLVAGIAGGLLLAFKGEAILKFLKSTLKFLKDINAKALLLQLKTLAIAAVFLVLFLLVEDFIGFMQGKDSVIGSVFEKMGIDVDQAKETIMGAWNTIKSFLGTTWAFIKNAAEGIWGTLTAFWEENGKEIFEELSSIWKSVVEVLTVLWDSICDIAKSVFEGLKDFWDEWGEKIKAQFALIWNYLIDRIKIFLDRVKGIIGIISGVFSGDWNKVWENVKAVVQSVWDEIVAQIKYAWKSICNIFGVSSEKVDTMLEDLGSVAQNVFQWIEKTATDIFNSLKAFWAEWGDKIMAQFGIIWDFICGLVDALKTYFQGLIDFITGVFTGNWEQAWEGIKTMFEGVLTGIKTVFTTIWDSIYNWFGDKIDAFVKKITDFADGIKEIFGGVADFFGGIGDAVSGFFGGGDYDATVKASTVNSSTGGGNKTTNVNQKVEIINNFEDGERAAQNEGAKAMGRAADDVSDKMAKAIGTG